MRVLLLTEKDKQSCKCLRLFRGVVQVPLKAKRAIDYSAVVFRGGNKGNGFVTELETFCILGVDVNRAIHKNSLLQVQQSDYNTGYIIAMGIIATNTEKS